MLSNFARHSIRMISTKPEEIKISVPWGHIAAKWWGPKNQRPILTTHGWMDNAGSFDTLVPLLPEHVSFLAVDLPGHGRSSKIPPGMVYHLSIDPILYTKLIQEHFGWKKMSFMGHSMGAATSFMYAVTYPSDVDFLICLDYLKAQFVENVQDYRRERFNLFMKIIKQMEMEPLNYTWEELAKRYQSASDSVDSDKVHYILKRNCMPSSSNPGKYVLTRDPRLKAHILYNIAHEEVLGSAKNLTMPVLRIKGNHGNYFENKKYFYETVDVVRKSSKDFRFYKVEGTHHLHLNNPERIKGYISDFLNTYYTG